MSWETLIRRSILLVSLADREAVEASWRHGADAIALDLADGVPEPALEGARGFARQAVALARRGGAEVFIRISRATAHADIEAAAWPGLTGIMLPSPEAGADILEIQAILVEAERRHGIASGALQIFVLLGTPAGIWNLREILLASPRISSAAIDETSLCRSLGIQPSEAFDPFLFAKGRLVIEATAARVQPIGISHPLGALPRLAESDELYCLAERGRNTGFKGVICPQPSWVSPCNRAMVPTQEQVEYYREVRRLFAEGVARGTAAVPFQGRMIDVPVDERAKLMIALWERHQQREAEKSAALATVGGL